MLRRTRLLRGTKPLKSHAPLKHNKNANRTDSHEAKRPSKRPTAKSSLHFAMPKHGRIQNQAVIDACRRPTCEVCGRPAGGEPHHIISRGAGGPDIPENLIQLCKACHMRAHNGQLKKEKILWTIASRFRTTPSNILAKIEAARSR